MKKLDTEKQLRKELVKVRYILVFAYKKPLFQYKIDIDKAICESLGLDYYETTVESYRDILHKILNDDL